MARAASSLSARYWGWFSVPSSWIQPCSSLGLGKGCDCLCSCCNALPWQAGSVPGCGGPLADLQCVGALRDSDPPTYTKIPGPIGQIRPKVWPSVKFVFPPLYGEQGEYFVIYVKMYIVHRSFLSPFVLLHHPQRGRPWNSFGGGRAACISCGSTLETQQLVLGTRGIGCILGIR